MKEVIETLVEAAGTADRVAQWLNVTAASVSEWRSDGGCSAQSLAFAQMMVCRYRNRSAYIHGWLLQRTTAANAVRLVVETFRGDALAAATQHRRGDRAMTATFTKQERAEVTRQLVRTYMASDLLADGDVLVFFRPGETTFVYVDLPEVEVGFTRRAWEPWWPLRSFVSE